MVYHAFFNIHRELYNPYGPRRVDIPHEVAAGQIRKLFAQLTDVGEASLPPSLVDDCRRRDMQFFAKVVQRNSAAIKLAAHASHMATTRSPQKGSVLDQSEGAGVRPLEPDVQQALLAAVSVGTGMADAGTDELLAALAS